MKDKVSGKKLNFLLLVLCRCFSAQGVRQKGVLSSQFCAVFIPRGRSMPWPQ